VDESNAYATADDERGKYNPTVGPDRERVIWRQKKVPSSEGRE
jgi:hypothetical protein